MQLVFQLHPRLETAEDRDFVLLGLAWALHPYAEKVRVHVELAAGLDLTPQVPVCVDPVALIHFKAVALFTQTPVIPSEAVHALMWKSSESTPKGALTRIDIDRNQVSHHLWNLQKQLQEYFEPELHHQPNAVWTRLLTWGDRRAYLFGSGPSLASLKGDDLVGGIRIICNGVALNREANRLIRPQFLLGIDPLHHCGMSAYAGKFVDAARDLMEQYGTLLVTRKEFVPWYRHRLPEQNIVGLDFVPNMAFQNQLEQSTQLNNQNGNVLCAAGLPVAAYLADEIVLVGFDGRDPQKLGADSNVRFFWRHDSNSELKNWEDSVSHVNPAVFDRDFDGYLENHARVVAQIFCALHERGKTLLRLTPSFIAPLANLPQTEQKKEQQQLPLKGPVEAVESI